MAICEYVVMGAKIVKGKLVKHGNSVLKGKILLWNIQPQGLKEFFVKLILYLFRGILIDVIYYGDYGVRTFQVLFMSKSTNLFDGLPVVIIEKLLKGGNNFREK